MQQGEPKCWQSWLESLNERDFLEDTHRWEDNIKMCIKEIG